MTTADDIDPPEGDDEEQLDEDERETPAESGPVDLVPIQRLAQGPRVRARTISMKRLSKRDLERGELLYPKHEHAEYARPKTRGECNPDAGTEHSARPCPWVSCVWHLALDVNPESGSVRINFPDVEVWDMSETCALDVADRGGSAQAFDGMTLEELGGLLGLTRERIRQLETKTLAKLKELGELAALQDQVDE